MDNRGQDNSLVYIVVGIIVMGAAVFGYEQVKGPVNSILIAITQGHLLLPSFLPGSWGAEAEMVRAKLATKAPESFTFPQVMAQLGFAMGYYRVIYVLLMVSLALWAWEMGVADKFRTVFSIKTLLRSNVQTFPCLAPVAYRDIEKESYDEGPWRTARQPVQFASEHGLLIDKDGKPLDKKLLIDKDGLANLNSPLIVKQKANRDVKLDKEKARKLFEAQLGEPFTSVFALPDYQKGLAAALMVFGHGDKKKGQAMLDQLSLSFREPGRSKKDPALPDPAQPLEIDITGADEILRKYADSEHMAIYTGKHSAFVHTWFHALLDFAARKGILPPSQFLWLRPTDRTLWYTLNQVGGRTPWTEASGPWAHYLAEEALGVAIETPEISEAVKALEDYLRETGWLPGDSRDSLLKRDIQQDAERARRHVGS